MPAPELVLRFPSADQVSVSFQGTDSGLLPFANPVTDQDRSDLRWYIETYGAHSLAGDEKEARRIQQRLPEIGKALFKAVFSPMEAVQPYLAFRGTDAGPRVLTIDSQRAAILSLPWELLHDPTGVFLFRERPLISVRRRIATGGRPAFPVQPKAALHLLFVVSRPHDAGFIDPRADSRAVLDALEAHAAGRVTCEFLRPATLNALHQRLQDDAKPPVDILHFDGHGVFRPVSEEEAQQHPDRFGRSIHDEIQREREARGAPNSPKAQPVGIGFLLFEKEDGNSHLISAEDLHDNLFRAQVGLVVLSACQSAALDAEGDPMTTVAGRLTATGIPAILAMTHAVLVATTQALFGQFYQSLARGRGIAAALDDARAWLNNNPEKFEVRRGSARRMLELDDWFLPALFHAGADTPLLIPAGIPGDSQPDLPVPLADDGADGPLHNLRPAHEAGFFGRRRELWNIERWLTNPAAPNRPATLRISITGFGGQGKTELALEATRWLLRTGAFRRAVFIDYAQVQSDDALGVAVSTIGNVLGETLADAEEAGRALAKAPTLVILDNLETLAPDPLAALLDAVAAWTEPELRRDNGPAPGRRPNRSRTRLLLTSRRPDHGHAAYRIEGTRKHRRIALDGLGSAAHPDDALDWYAALAALPGADDAQAVPPPDRDALIALFDRVAFHPLSIAVLAQQLRTRSATQLGARLDALLEDRAVSAIAEEGTPASLIASLHLSLDRLSPAQRQAVERLGVFRGGAMEDNLLAITGLGSSHQTDGQRAHLLALLAAIDGNDPRDLMALMGVKLPDGAKASPEMLTRLRDSPGFRAQLQGLRDQLATLPAPVGAADARTGTDPNPWPALRRQLETAALIEAEHIPGVNPPFLRFHPTLAPLLWAGLTEPEQAALTLAHRRRYYQLAGYLYSSDRKNPDQARAIARREMPNLLQALDRALAVGDEEAVLFVVMFNQFLTIFGRTSEAADLTRRAELAGGAAGSHAWFLAEFNRGEQLLAAGQVAAAAACFQAILQGLGEAPSYELAVTLGRLGRCNRAGGRTDLAEAQHRRGIEVTLGLLELGQQELTEELTRLRGVLQTELGDVLMLQGRFGEAKEQYLNAEKIAEEQDDSRQQGVVLAQLGLLALQQGDLTDAVRRYEAALALFQRLREPAMEAEMQNGLGLVFLRARQWEQAERHFREAAVLAEQRSDLAGAARTWNNLAKVCEGSGRPEAAETWYRKAIEGGKATGERLPTAHSLSSLADLLQQHPDRISEARRLAEESLAIKETLDPGAAHIWITYALLAQIADRQSRPEEAAQYRRQARDAKRRFPGTAHEVKRFAPAVAAVVGAVQGNPEAIAATEELVRKGDQAGGETAEFARVVQRILAGERNPDALCGNLSFHSSPVVETILQALAAPSILDNLRADRDDPE